MIFDPISIRTYLPALGEAISRTVRTGSVNTNGPVWVGHDRYARCGIRPVDARHDEVHDLISPRRS